MDECTENAEEVKLAEITSTELHSAGHENVCVCSYTIYVILLVIALAISIGIGAYSAYSCWLFRLFSLSTSLAFVLNGIAHKQQFNELINGKHQINRDQKLNLLFLQRHN